MNLKEKYDGTLLQFFYECTNCETVLRPKKGNCCVFCSFGSVQSSS
ncbi:MAG: GDCCVxC domain-containing (seleno)protein [Mariniphaga sp.]|nr:GDCCVxC domain-containing (seleno)protein [Mariniphaga sp.]